MSTITPLNSNRAENRITNRIILNILASARLQYEHIIQHLRYARKVSRYAIKQQSYAIKCLHLCRY